MKWFCTAVLLVALLSWRVSPAYELPLNVAVSYLASIAAFALSIRALKTRPLLAIPSIVGQRGSEAL